MASLDHRQDNGRSSVFEKLPPDLRRHIDIAIIERVPPTYAAVWMEFKLGENGVTYSAFYRYARRLRDSANLAEVAALTSDEPDGLDTAIKSLVARRVLDTLLTDDELPPREIATLVSTLRQSSRTVQENRKIIEDARLAWARLELERELRRIKASPGWPNSDETQSAVQRLLSPDSPDLSAKAPAERRPVPTAPDNGRL